MLKKIESSAFKRWLASIRDNKTRARVVARVNRLIHGLPGDVQPIGRGLSELRLRFGAGLRVYFYQDRDTLVVLLNGGDKSTQAQDIAKAHAIFKQWRDRDE